MNTVTPRQSAVITTLPARSMNEPAAAVNEHRTVVIRFRWHTLLTVLATFIIGVAVGLSIATPIILGAVR
jgi:hypothetical protein